MLSTLPHKPPHKLDKMENKSERCSQRWVFVVLHNKIVVLVLPYLIRVKLNLVKHVAEIKRMGHFSKLSYKKRTYQMNWIRKNKETVVPRWYRGRNCLRFLCFLSLMTCLWLCCCQNCPKNSFWTKKSSLGVMRYVTGYKTFFVLCQNHVGWS